MTRPGAATDATLVAIMKDERPYVVEWVAYHRVIGFDRILIYSNDCSDGTDVLLDRMSAAGLVTHRRWPSRPGLSPQIAAYGDAIGAIGTHWVMFLDADEFLCLRRDAGLADLLGRFDADVSAIAVNWRLFGSSGHVWQGPRPVIERFTRAAIEGGHNERHCKTIAVAADVAEASVHRVFLTRGRYVDTTGRDIEIERLGFTSTVEHGLAQVNHYLIKSAAEHERKRRRGRADMAPDDAQRHAGRGRRFFRNADTNDVEDTRILDRLSVVTAEVARIETLLAALP